MSLQVQRLDGLIHDETIEGRLSVFSHFLWCYIFRFEINIYKVKLHVGKKYDLDKKNIYIYVFVVRRNKMTSD